VQIDSQRLVLHKIIEKNMPKGNLHLAQCSKNSPPSKKEWISRLKQEAARLATFKRWSSPDVTAEDLARVGFFYVEKEDLVQCIFCFGTIKYWRPCDDAMGEHRRFFGRRCPFVMGLSVGNIPIHLHEPPFFDISKIRPRDAAPPCSRKKS
jgi:hypothetical protein